MKVKTLQRRHGVERECSGDLRRSARNLAPQHHPMARAREYQRAVVASKMSRMFAQPLIAKSNMEHRDAVTCSALSRRSLLPLASGSADGAVKLWDLASRKAVANLETAHTRTVTGLTFDITGQAFYSCSDDGYVHRWNIHASKPDNEDTAEPSHGPTASWRTAGSFKSLDHHWMDQDTFCTASDAGAVQIWSAQRSTAVATYDDLWGSADTVHCVRYNPAERALLAHCCVDRGVGLHDTRTHQALGPKAVLRMKCNDLQWNPMEPFVFCVANEDGNAYTFDMRKLQRPVRIFKGHTSAILSVAWSPTGREFVTGSYDRTVRIFSSQENRAREIYHTKRMQRVWTVQYTMDAKFIVTGSDDSNLRLWKAQANQDVSGQLTTRQEAATQYRASLIKKYQHLPQVRKITRARKIPKTIRNQTQQAAVQKASRDRKHANRVKYSKTNAETGEPEHKFVPEREKTVVKKID